MKTLPFVFLAVMATAASVYSQDEGTAVPEEPIVAPSVSRDPVVLAAPSATVSASIPHDLAVPEFTPPSPPVVKPVPVMRVDSAIIIPTKNSRTLTLLRGEASTLPDIPPPPPAAPPQAKRELTPEEVASNTYNRRHWLSVGATIYDHRTSAVHWYHPDTGEQYEAVCGFDLGLLGGTGGFIHNSESYSLMLMYSSLDSAVLRRFARNYVPALPEVMPDSILIVKGNPQDPIGTAPITVLRDVIASERARLVTYQAARERYQAASAAWHKANPPIPRDETYWIRPHRGSRYLKPASQGGDK